MLPLRTSVCRVAPGGTAVLAAQAHAAEHKDDALPPLLKDGLRLEQRTEPVELAEIATLVVGVEWSAIAAGTFVQCDVGNELAGCSLIWLAAEAGKASVLMALLKAGGDPSTPNKKKTTPVHIAAQRHDAEAIRALLAAAAERGGGLLRCVSFPFLTRRAPNRRRRRCNGIAN